MNNRNVIIPFKDRSARKPFPLPHKEYGKICSEINSVYDARYKGKKIAAHPSFGVDGRAYVYWFENRGFNDYNIFRRDPDEH